MSKYTYEYLCELNNEEKHLESVISYANEIRNTIDDSECRKAMNRLRSRSFRLYSDGRKWTGDDAEAYFDKVHELYWEAVHAIETMQEALAEIRDEARKEEREINEEIVTCYDEMNVLEKIETWYHEEIKEDFVL